MRNKTLVGLDCFKVGEIQTAYLMPALKTADLMTALKTAKYSKPPKGRGSFLVVVSEVRRYDSSKVNRCE